ncbi:MAG: hypothetical protein K6G65_03675 [Lachnospiraceae bacterium]|nr:hypothetical protein [Lachnospiraceae bacterium]
MKHIEKGNVGYIDSKKKSQLLLTILMALIGIAIFLVGFVLNKYSNKNLFTILAILFVLPAARFLTTYFVLFKYHSSNKEQYDALKKILPDNTDLFSDLVITSSEHVFHMDFVVIGNENVIGLCTDTSKHAKDLPSYLTNSVHNWAKTYKVKICSTYEEFERNIKNITECQIIKEEEDNVISLILSLIV